jgi:rubredoxin
LEFGYWGLFGIWSLGFGIFIKGEDDMEKYKCTVCGYIYDPEKGDEDGGVSPGTPFAKVPDSWVCPACGAPKDMFEKV